VKNNREQTSREGRDSGELFADPTEVVSFAQAFYATEFPNTERRGCPASGALRESAHSEDLPGPELREHLFGCSECFLAYRGARLSRVVRPTTREPWRERFEGVLARLTLRPALTAAGLACLIIIAGVLAAVVWRAGKAPESAVNLPSVRPVSETPAQPTGDIHIPAPPAPEVPAAATREEGATANGRSAARPRRQRRARVAGQMAALRVIEISLNDATLLRGTEGAGEGRRVISLPPERQLLRLRLPAGNGRGRYTVAVIDAFGKVLTSATARSDGKTLTVELDLRSWPEKRCRLSVSRAGEAPDFYVLNIAAKTPTR
jgi:hypothetical protein